MKIYVASHCQELGRAAARELERAGHRITSSWLSMEFKPTDQHAKEDRPEIAKLDTDDVLRSDALVLLSGPDRYPGGKFVEAGIAIGANIPVVVIGRRENMLLHHPSIRRFDTVSEFVEAVRLPVCFCNRSKCTYDPDFGCGFYSFQS